jgi:hypothetical protein
MSVLGGAALTNQAYLHSATRFAPPNTTYLLLLYSYSTSTLLLLYSHYSYSTSTLFPLYTYSTPTPTPTLLLLYSYSIPTLFPLYFYATPTLLALYSHSTRFAPPNTTGVEQLFALTVRYGTCAEGEKWCLNATVTDVVDRALVYVTR